MNDNLKLQDKSGTCFRVFLLILLCTMLFSVIRFEHYPGISGDTDSVTVPVSMQVIDQIFYVDLIFSILVGLVVAWVTTARLKDFSSSVKTGRKLLDRGVLLLGAILICHFIYTGLIVSQSTHYMKGRQNNHLYLLFLGLARTLFYLFFFFFKSLYKEIKYHELNSLLKRFITISAIMDGFVLLGSYSIFLGYRGNMDVIHYGVGYILHFLFIPWFYLALKKEFWNKKDSLEKNEYNAIPYTMAQKIWLLVCISVCFTICLIIINGQIETGYPKALVKAFFVSLLGTLFLTTRLRGGQYKSSRPSIKKIIETPLLYQSWVLQFLQFFYLAGILFFINRLSEIRNMGSIAYLIYIPLFVRVLYHSLLPFYIYRTAGRDRKLHYLWIALIGMDFAIFIAGYFIPDILANPQLYGYFYIFINLLAITFYHTNRALALLAYDYPAELAGAISFEVPKN